MENKNIFETLGQYRLKVERDGRSVADVPGLFCLPCLLAAPRLGIASLVAAPLLGYNVRLEAEGRTVLAEDVVKKAAETVTTAAKNVREEIDRAFQEAAGEADETEPAECEEKEEPAGDPVPDLNREIVEELQKEAEAPEVPTIQVNPEDEEEQ